MRGLVLLTLLLGLVAFSSAAIVCKEERNQFVTIDANMLLEMVKCARLNPGFCYQFAECERLVSPPVGRAILECEPGRPSLGALNPQTCYYSSPLFNGPDAPEKLLKCVTDRTPSQTSNQKRIFVNFEDCAKQFLETTCVQPRVVVYTEAYTSATASASSAASSTAVA